MATRRADARRIEWMPLDEVKPAKRNPKRHALEDIGASMARHGVVEFPTLDERTGRLVAGHGRIDALKAARKAGTKAPEGVRVSATAWLVPVVRGWRSKSDEDAEAYLVGSNRLPELGGWDDAALAKMLKGMAADGDAALAGVGYSDEDVERLLAQASTAVDAELQIMNTSGHGSGRVSPSLTTS